MEKESAKMMKQSDFNDKSLTARLGSGFYTMVDDGDTVC